MERVNKEARRELNPIERFNATTRSSFFMFVYFHFICFYFNLNNYLG